MGIRIFYTSRILICCGYVTLNESLYNRVITWVNAILNHIDTRISILVCEGSCIVVDLYDIENKHIVKYP